MANKYFAFEELLALADTLLGEQGMAAFKPPKTEGNHQMEFMVCCDDEIELRGETTEGDYSYATLHPGDTLQYDCGRLRVIPDWRTVKDPLNAAMIRFRLGKHRLVWVDELPQYTFYQGFPVCATNINGMGVPNTFYALKGTDRGVVADYIIHCFQRSERRGI